MCDIVLNKPTISHIKTCRRCSTIRYMHALGNLFIVPRSLPHNCNASICVSARVPDYTINTDNGADTPRPVCGLKPSPDDNGRPQS